MPPLFSFVLRTARLALCALALTALISTPGTAQSADELSNLFPSDMCFHGSAKHQTSVQELLIGEWSAKHHAGYMLIPGAGALPFPAGRPEPVTLWTQGGKLYGSGGEPVQTVELKWAKEGPWAWRDEAPAGVKPLMTTDVLRSETKCDFNTLPRLVGRTSFKQDGADMNFVMRLFVTSENQMYGLLQVTGMVSHGGKSAPFKIGRSVLLRRN